MLNTTIRPSSVLIGNIDRNPIFVYFSSSDCRLAIRQKTAMQKLPVGLRQTRSTNPYLGAVLFGHRGPANTMVRSGRRRKYGVVPNRFWNRACFADDTARRFFPRSSLNRQKIRPCNKRPFCFISLLRFRVTGLSIELCATAIANDGPIVTQRGTRDGFNLRGNAGRTIIKRTIRRGLMNNLQAIKRFRIKRFSFLFFFFLTRRSELDSS